MIRTPLERLDREIALYIQLVDARRARGADTIDHVAHLELLYVQRAAMVSRVAWPTADDLDDAAALAGAEPPPVPDVADELRHELENHARPARWLQAFPQVVTPPLSKRELEPIRNAVSIVRHRRGGWLRRLGRALRAVWDLAADEDPRRTYERAGLSLFR